MIQDDLNFCQTHEQEACTKAKKGSNPKGIWVECLRTENSYTVLKIRQ